MNLIFHLAAAVLLVLLLWAYESLRRKFSLLVWLFRQEESVRVLSVPGVFEDLAQILGVATEGQLKEKAWLPFRSLPLRKVFFEEKVSSIVFSGSIIVIRGASDDSVKALQSYLKGYTVQKVP